jgi:hypothetical protein
LIQFRQFLRLSSAFCAASLLPKYSTEHLFPFESVSQVILFPPHQIS